jgi:hypothetical protein
MDAEVIADLDGFFFFNNAQRIWTLKSLPISTVKEHILLRENTF